MKRTIFLSGPFSNSCMLLRSLAKRIFAEEGHEILEKHGGVSTPAAELIDSADFILYIYGTEAAGITDVWGRSLVIRELEYAAHRKKPSCAIILGQEKDVKNGEILRLRKHLIKQLNDKACLMPEFLDYTDSDLYAQLASVAIETIWCNTRNQDLPHSLAKELPENIVEGLTDKNTASTTYSSLVSSFKDKTIPDYRAIEAYIKDIEVLASTLDTSVGPVVSDLVFISYSRDDKNIVKRIQQALSQSGYSVWRDENKITGGEYITATVLQGIANSGAVLVLSSPSSAKSTWVKKEVDFALNIQKQAGWNNFLIPLSLNDSGHGLIEGLEDINHLPIRTNDLFEDDIEEVIKNVDEPRLWHKDHDK